MNVQIKKIGLFSAIIIQSNAMIGAGIVAIPAILSQSTGFLGLLAYLACILIIFSMTVSLGELSLLHGGSAWCYRFPALWGKHSAGLNSSICYLVGILISMGFVAKQAGIWLHEVIPFLSSNLLALLITGFLSLLVIAGKNVSSFWQYVISGIILLGILTMTGVCFTHFDEKIFFHHRPWKTSSFISVAPVLLFSLLGFESISSLYAIVKNPKRNVLIGGMIGVCSVGLLYIAFSTSVVGSIHPSAFNSVEEQSLATILNNTFPNFRLLSKLVYNGGLFAIIGTLHSILWSVSILFLDILRKFKNQTIRSWISQERLTTHQTLIFSSLTIMGASYALTSHSIMYLGVFLIATSYTLSIGALFKEKKHKLLNRILCIIGMLGACLMGFFSLYSLTR
ncbi:MAG: amino acid permease [Chlamydiales bacterium]|nr:amino acid permease [Chlamydiales bacterium]